MFNNDESVERATTFNYVDAQAEERLDGSESKRNHYNRLGVFNSLDWNGKWKDRKKETQKNASAIVDAITCQLELTDYQKRETHRRFNALPDSYNEAYSTAMLALCVAGHVARKDGRDYHPNNLNRDDDDRNFTQLVDELGINQTVLNSCWIRVRRQVF